MNCEIVLQIFSGGFSGTAVSCEKVEQKLLSVLPRLPVSKVIMGWSPDKSIYQKTARLLEKRNIEFYLWFPVFSETGKLAPLNPLIDILGQKPENAIDHGDEDFSFCCPAEIANTESILNIFEENFSSIPFTGIFLDKIRYPSFAQARSGGDGKRSVFTCFCPRCQAIYKKEGFDFIELKNVLLSYAPATTPLGITSYRGNGGYSFSEPAISRFFSIKADLIYRSMRQICAFFREKGYRIGFDVFAPFLSLFVGQNLPLLGGLCDFMKPMMYRLTNAPAGLPFETEALLSGCGCAEPFMKQSFYDILGFDPSRKVFDLVFTVKELNRLAASSPCPVYAGLEINRIKNLAEVEPDYIEETAKAYASSGVRGLVLSWDLLEAPEENIRRVIDVHGQLSQRS